MAPEFADFENDLRFEDIGIETWDGELMHRAYMRFGKRSDMLAIDWDGIAEAIGIQNGKPVQRMIVNEYMGAVGSGGRLASGGWRTIATWVRPVGSELYMVWNSTADWKGTKNYERDLRVIRFGA